MNDQNLNIIFVGEVEKHEVLYNYTLPGYSRKDITEKAWQEVAAKVNMSAGDCKEKWRNLRTVFIRKMKPNGSGANKKAYYLAEAMQFCLPYVKVLAPPSCGNLPQVQKYEMAEESSDADDSRETVWDWDSFQSPTTPPGYKSPDRSGRTIPPQDSTAVLPQDSTAVQPLHNTRPPVQSSSTRAKRSMTKSAAVADQCATEYFKAKQARLDSTADDATNGAHRVDRTEAVKMFLLSLMPELEELNDYQIKLFKRRIFSVIDEITNQYR